MNSISWSPVLWYATPLPMNRTPVSTVGGPFPPFCGTPGLVSIACSVQDGCLPRVPLPPDEHDAFCCLPMNTTTTQFLRFDPAMCTSPGRTYARVGIRDPARMYVRGHIFWHVSICMCTQFRWDSLNSYMAGSTKTCATTYSAMVHRCKATD